jgi:excisionase family DNA binding protein
LRICLHQGFQIIAVERGDNQYLGMAPRSLGKATVKASNQIESTSPSSTLPALLTTTEIAAILRTSIKGIYAMVERGQLPGVIRIGRRRLLFRQDALVDWLRQKSQAPSPESGQR